MTYFSKPPLGTPLDWSNPLNKGCVLHLGMNEGHGDKVQDLSMYGNHGTLKNFAFPPTAASGWNPGQTGRGLNFDGANDYVDCGNSDSLNFGTGDFTLSACVYSNGYSNQGSSVNAIMSKGILTFSPSTFYGFFITSSEEARFVVIDDGNHVIGPNIQNGWHHLVGYRSGDNIYFYIDGVYQGTDTVSGSTTSSNDLYIGEDAALNRYFNGSIDQVRIYNRALSAKEIQEYYINPWAVYLDE